MVYTQSTADWRGNVDDELGPAGGIECRVGQVKAFHQPANATQTFGREIGKQDRPRVGLVNIVYFRIVKRLGWVIDRYVPVAVFVLSAGDNRPIAADGFDNSVHGRQFLAAGFLQLNAERTPRLDTPAGLALKR